jgi:hypothetical protein
MLATGGLLVSIALLTLALLAPIFHGSDPPRWTTRGWIGELVTVSIVCVLALGLVQLGAGAIEAVRSGPKYLDLGLLAVVLTASILIWRRLKARAPRTTTEPAASLDVAGSASGRVPAQPPAAASDSPPPHKAA